MERVLEGFGEGRGFDDGVEEDDVGVVGLVEDEASVRGLVERGADGDEVGKDLVGLVEVVAEEVGVDLGELGSGFAAVEEAEDPPLHLPATHLNSGSRLSYKVGLTKILL